MPYPRKFDQNMTVTLPMRLTPDQFSLLTLAAQQTGKSLVDAWRDAMISLATVAITGIPEAKIDLTTLEVKTVDNNNSGAPES